MVMIIRLKVWFEVKWLFVWVLFVNSSLGFSNYYKKAIAVPCHFSSDIWCYPADTWLEGSNQVTRTTWRAPPVVPPVCYQIFSFLARPTIHFIYRSSISCLLQPNPSQMRKYQSGLVCICVWTCDTSRTNQPPFTKNLESLF